jgi:hypothetical protein
MIDLEKIAYDIGFGKSNDLTRWMLPIATLEEMISLIRKQEAELTAAPAVAQKFKYPAQPPPAQGDAPAPHSIGYNDDLPEDWKRAADGRVIPPADIVGEAYTVSGVQGDALSQEAADPIRELIALHAEELDQNDYAYFELARTRRTGWMAWICTNLRDDDPDRNVLATGQGDTPDEACTSAVADYKARALAAPPAAVQSDSSNPLFDRKLSNLEQRGYKVIGRILHKDSEYALFDSSCRWLTKPQYQRLMHEQDGSLFAAQQPDSGRDAAQDDPLPQGWSATHAEPWDALTDKAQQEQRISVSRLSAPFCDSAGRRCWAGPTLADALKTAHEALGITMAAQQGEQTPAAK